MKFEGEEERVTNNKADAPMREGFLTNGASLGGLNRKKYRKGG